MSTMPPDADSLVGAPSCDAIADGVNPPGDLVTWNTRILNTGPQALFNKYVTVTNSTRFHFYANLSGAGLRKFTFDKFESPASS
jgi:hypothetical protein